MRTASRESTETSENKLRKFAIAKILVAVGIGDQVSKIVEIALNVAMHFHSQLFFAHAASLEEMDDAPTDGAKLEEACLAEGYRHLEKVVAIHPRLKTVPHHQIVSLESPVELVRRLVETENIDLIVAGSHGAGRLERLARGSLSEAILRKTECPTLIVGPGAMVTANPFQRVLLATDLEHCEAATRYAAAVAMECHGELDAVHVMTSAPASVIDPPPAVNELVARHNIRAMLPGDITSSCSVRLLVRHGDPGRIIPQVAAECGSSLIVTGVSEGLLHDDHSPWSTFAAIVKAAECPVLAVPSRNSHCFND